MRFLVDECTGSALARWLREQNHDVYFVYDEARGMEDNEIVQKAFAENRVLITNDKDFGEKVYRERWPHRGVILLRLDDERTVNKVNVIRSFLELHMDRMTDQFVVVTEKAVRFAHH